MEGSAAIFALIGLVLELTCHQVKMLSLRLGMLIPQDCRCQVHAMIGGALEACQGSEMEHIGLEFGQQTRAVN